MLSDIVMPGGMNGIALAQEIGNRYPQIPVVLTSGYSDLAQAAESRFVILRKPFQLPALDKSIREALEHGGTRDDGAAWCSSPRSAARPDGDRWRGSVSNFTLLCGCLASELAPRLEGPSKSKRLLSGGWDGRNM